MASAAIEFLIASLIIVLAATVLTRCADTIADRTRLGRLLVGSIFLAVATSLPELATGISAVRLKMPDLAVGNVLGSSLFNLLILALADVMHRSRGGMLSRLSAAHSLSGAVTIALTAIVGIGILIEPKIATRMMLWVSPAVIAVVIGYAFGIRLVLYDQRAGAAVAALTTGGEEKPARRSLGVALIGYALTAIVILAVAPRLARSAGELAHLTGMGGTFVGTTLVALATSLPELVATFTAVRMGAFDLAVGNIFGSNAFNMLMLAPLDWAAPGSILAAVSETHALTSFAVILITSVAILGQLYRVEKRILLIEPDAALVILLVVMSLLMIYYAP